MAANAPAGKGTVSVRQTSFNGGVVSPLVSSRNDLERYAVSLKTARNFIVSQYGSAMNRPGTRYLGEVKYSARKTRIVRFVFSTVQAYILEVGHNYIRIWKDYGIVISTGTTPVEVVTTYTEDQLSRMKFSQSFDTLIITHPSHPVRKLTRSSHTSWSLSAVSFGSTISAPTSFATNDPVGEAECTYAVSAVSLSGEESVLSNTAHANQLDQVGDYIPSTWAAVTGADYYKMYRRAGTVSNDGTWGYCGWSKSASYFLKNGEFSVDQSISPISAKTVFSSSGDYPAASSFFEQRLVFAAPSNAPQTIYGSRVGTYFNFNTRVLLQDDDPYEFTLNSQSMNEIRWMAPLREMLIGTAVGIFKMSPGGSNGTVTPNSVQINAQTFVGVDYLDPIVTGTQAICVDISKTKVFALQYTYESESYQDTDLTLYASHLFEGNQIVSMDYQDSPNRVVWAAGSNGNLYGLTYYREQKVFGWHVHDTQNGVFEEVQSLPNGLGGTDVYFIVKRTIDGSEKRYIEVLSERIPTAGSVLGTAFMDSSLSLESGTPFSSVTGLDHLEGEEVVALVDGFEERHTVSSGAITLDNSEATSCTVGLPYTCELETLDLDYDGARGSILDKLRRVVSVQIGVSDTAYAEVGPSSDKTDPVPIRVFGAIPNDPPALVTGEYDVSLEPAAGGKSTRVHVRTTKPFPVTVTSITARIEYGDSA